MEQIVAVEDGPNTKIADHTIDVGHRGAVEENGDVAFIGGHRQETKRLTRGFHESKMLSVGAHHEVGNHAADETRSEKLASFVGVNFDANGNESDTVSVDSRDEGTFSASLAVGAELQVENLRERALVTALDDGGRCWVSGAGVEVGAHEGNVLVIGADLQPGNRGEGWPHHAPVHLDGLGPIALLDHLHRDGVGRGLGRYRARGLNRAGWLRSGGDSQRCR